MSWFSNLKISIKLIVGFMIVAVIAAVIGIVGVVNIVNINHASSQLYTDNTLGLKYAGEIAIQFQGIRINTLRLLLVSDENERSEHINKIREHVADTEDKLRSYESGISNENDRKLFSRVKNLWANYTSLLEDTIKFVESGKTEEAQTLIFEESSTIIDSLNDMFLKLFEHNTSAAEEKANSNNKVSFVAVNSMFVVVVIGVIMAICLGLIISRSISKPIKRLEEAAEQLALGDVDVKIESTTKDEIGNLMVAFSKMVDNIREQAYTVESLANGDMTVQVKIKSENDLMGKKLNEMIKSNNEILGKIRSAADEVAFGAKLLSDSSQILSHGATEQSISIEEITASMSQIAEQTKKNAINAGRANEISLKAKENAMSGNSQMQEMIRAVTEINESSTNISKIIKVIDEIAFQTNILALNAAIEAARAGQYGKGFAVVADEVRNLAVRSANAAKETTVLIENSIKKVEIGNKIADNTAEALNEIVEDVTKVADLVEEISAASNDQALDFAQINEAISQVAQVVQTNSATAEEDAAASEELSAQAEVLKESVSRFKLKKLEENLELEGLEEVMEEMGEDVDSEKLNQQNEQQSDDNNEELDIVESEQQDEISH